MGRSYVHQTAMMLANTRVLEESLHLQVVGPRSGVRPGISLDTGVPGGLCSCGLVGTDCFEYDALKEQRGSKGEEEPVVEGGAGDAHDGGLHQEEGGEDEGGPGGARHQGRAGEEGAARQALQGAIQMGDIHTRLL